MIRPQIPRVALLVDTSTGWGRRLVRGVVSYAHKHGPWDLWLEPCGQREPLRLPPGWQGDGVIARVATRAMANHLRQNRKIVVNVSAIRISGFKFPRVSTDTDAAVHMALDHFIDRGIRQLGYVGLPHRVYSAERQQAFASAAAEAGCEFFAFTSRPRGAGKTTWKQQQATLREWLTGLPKPTGIFAWGVQRGTQVITAACHAGLRVPDEVAVLGGDDDELVCEAVRPSLSGLNTGSEQIGHEAAAMLGRLMGGEKIDQQVLYVEPTCIVARGSTDVLALDDADVVAAVRFIRENAHRAIRVSDVTNAVAMARRSLERRFQRVFDRTIAQEISRLRIERAKKLLAESDLQIPRVAEASGFGSPEYLATVFRREFGVTPLKYRTKVRGR